MPLRQKQATASWLDGRDFAEPDVAVADGMIVILQREREPAGVGLVRLAGDGGALNFHVVLHENSIVKEGDAPETDELAVLIEARGMEDYVVGLPLAGRREAFTSGGYWP